MNNRLYFRAYNVDYSNRIDILLGQKDLSGEVVLIAKPLQINLIPKEAGRYVAEPSLSFAYEEAQDLITALWDAGLRPHNYQSVDGEVRRLNDHLQDMRALVFKEGIKL